MFVRLRAMFGGLRRFYCNTQDIYKGPGLKPRAFCFLEQGKMTDTKSKRQAEFVRQHTLTEQDLRKMIAEKLERARAYHNAQLKRKALKENR